MFHKNNHQNNEGQRQEEESEKSSKSFYSTVSVPLTEEQWKDMQIHRGLRKTFEGMLEEVARRDRKKDQRLKEMEEKKKEWEENKKELEENKKELEEENRRLRQGFCCEGMKCHIF
jgi:hypothetical protein